MKICFNPMPNYKKITVITILVMSAIFLNTVCAAEDQSVAAGLKISTQGAGIEGRLPVAKHLFVRGGFSYGQHTSTYKSSQLNIKSKLTVLSAPIMLDWHPFDNSGFRLSAGITYNGNKAKGRSSSNKAAIIEGISYTADEIGLITTTLKPGSAIAGIASIGYDGSFLHNSPFSINVEAGVMYSGNSKISVMSNGSGDAAVKSAIERDVKSNLKSAKKYFSVFPVFSVGFKYAF